MAKDDDTAATNFLISVLKNVTSLDKDARTSITNFEKSIGDVAITYENEVIVGKQAGADYDLVIPRSTILIENPVALIDASIDKHGNRKAVEAFINFLFTKEAQTILAQYGLRSIDAEVAKSTAAQFPAVRIAATSSRTLCSRSEDVRTSCPATSAPTSCLIFRPAAR